MKGRPVEIWCSKATTRRRESRSGLRPQTGFSLLQSILDAVAPVLNYSFNCNLILVSTQAFSVPDFLPRLQRKARWESLAIRTNRYIKWLVPRVIRQHLS